MSGCYCLRMAKRGETKPWRVSFKWADSGIKGTIAYGTEEEAEMKADEIRHNGEVREMDVTVTVAKRA